MQTFCIVGHIKKYAKVQRYLEDWEEAGDIAKHRYRVLCFYDKHGLEATLDAFSISRRTLFRWKAKLVKNRRVIDLKPRSSKPFNLRASRIHPLITSKIRETREIYPNLGKEKIFHLKDFRDFCIQRNLSIPSISTIGRIISKDTHKMRYALRKSKMKRIRTIREEKEAQRLYFPSTSNYCNGQDYL